MGTSGFDGAASEAGLYGYGNGTIASVNLDPAVSKASANGLAALKGVALFFAAPFFGLAYILLFPLVGLGMAVWFGGKALMKYGAARKAAEVAKRAGMIVAAPLLGLAFVTLLPLFGAGMLAWIGGRAAVA
jgi:hypothetical protein